MDWLNPDDHWPDWTDAEKRIEIEDESGHRSRGTLVADDVVFDDEGEYPIFAIEYDDGQKIAFAGCRRWRFV